MIQLIMFFRFNINNKYFIKNSENKLKYEIL